MAPKQRTTSPSEHEQLLDRLCTELKALYASAISVEWRARVQYRALHSASTGVPPVDNRDLHALDFFQLQLVTAANEHSATLAKILSAIGAPSGEPDVPPPESGLH